MPEWIKTVFVDGQYYGGMWASDLPEVKSDFRKNAVAVLEDTGADHVVYCHIGYDTETNIKTVWLYNGYQMDDKTFYERTSTISDRDFVGAIHNRK